MLNEQLQKQIEQEADDLATNSEKPDGFRFGLEDGYIPGATKYAEKWQHEKELRERYEKALNAILNTNHDNHERVILKVKSLATEALTPKTSTDDTDNG